MSEHDEDEARQRCPQCRRQFAVLADERDMHACPFCGYGRADEDDEDDEDEDDGA